MVYQRLLTFLTSNFIAVSSFSFMVLLYHLYAHLSRGNFRPAQKLTRILQILAHFFFIAFCTQTTIRHVEITAPSLQTKVVNHFAAGMTLENLYATDATIAEEQFPVALSVNNVIIGTTHHFSIALVIVRHVLGLFFFRVHFLNQSHNLHLFLSHFIFPLSHFVVLIISYLKRVVNKFYVKILLISAPAPFLT